MRSRLLPIALFLFLLSPSACNAPLNSSDPEAMDLQDPSDPEAIPESAASDDTPEIHQDSIPSEEIRSSLIAPEDLTYLGAFRLPGENGGSSWEYSGYAMAYYPEGDPGGPNDGFPGSLFAVGHDHQQYVSEISIPVPLTPNEKNPDALNTATTLQPFTDISGGRFGYLEIPRAGLEILPPQGAQDEWKLYFCWGQHFEDAWAATHGWSSLDLASAQPAGPWHVAGYSNYVTNDYLFEIPAEWAEIYTPGLRLATGRFRDGIWGGLGPSLIAISPWLNGNPPARESTLTYVTPLLLYGRQLEGNLEIDISGIDPMVTFQEPDEWSGGAWLTAGDRSALVFVGTKALGKSWYGFANGVEYPTSGDPGEVYPEVPPWPYDSRGWWSEDISAQIYFFDPAELGAVARGEMNSWEPQPYAALAIDEHLYDPGFDHELAKRYLLGAAAFDRQHGLLYIVERRADGDKSLIHVFRISD